MRVFTKQSTLQQQKNHSNKSRLLVFNDHKVYNVYIVQSTVRIPMLNDANFLHRVSIFL